MVKHTYVYGLNILISSHFINNPTLNQIRMLKYIKSTLDSGIDIAPGINVAPPLKNFHITILILFYIDLGIAVIFYFIFLAL